MGLHRRVFRQDEPVESGADSGNLDVPALEGGGNLVHPVRKAASARLETGNAQTLNKIQLFLKSLAGGDSLLER